MERSEAGPRYWLLHLALPLALTAAAAAVLQFTDLDRRVSDLYFDPLARTFPRKEDPFFQAVLHRGLKYGVILVGAAAVLALVLGWRRPALRPWRGPLIYFVACTAAIPALVGLLKATSWKHCPWDVVWYGGYAPYVHPFDAAVEGVRAGRCYPGGHASGGYALFAAYFALRRRAPGWARFALAAALVYGSVMGWARIAMGAHFVSHIAATAVVAWFTCLVLYEAGLRRREGRAPRAG